MVKKCKDCLKVISFKRWNYREGICDACKYLRKKAGVLMPERLVVDKGPTIRSVEIIDMNPDFDKRIR